MRAGPQTASLKPSVVPASRPFLGSKPVPKPSVATAAAAGDAAPAPKKILGYEPLTWAKILPLGLMFFCILFNYTILRDTKVRVVS
jgi:ATP:ADP antiporter, AAA family